MKTMNKITGLILARGGSVGIFKKNLLKLGEHSLIARCIQTMKAAKCFDSIWVSTDDNEIANEAEKEGASVHWRQSYTATNSASSLTAVQEFLTSHEELQSSAICLVQCTSPFLKPRYLLDAAALIEEGRFDSVFAAVRSHGLRWSQTEDGTVSPLNLEPSSRPSRQQWKGELLEAGMFYMTSATAVLEHGLLQYGS